MVCRRGEPWGSSAEDGGHPIARTTNVHVDLVKATMIT